jgi:Spy/CpxP family protein refolding chaperone
LRDQRDFHTGERLVVPFVLDVVVDRSPQIHKVILDKVAVKSKLDVSLHTRRKA